MPRPVEIQKALNTTLPFIECQGAKFHSPRPLITHPYTYNNRTYHLCGTCHENLTVFITLSNAYDILDWPLLRSFGNEIRRIGLVVTKGK